MFESLVQNLYMALFHRNKALQLQAYNNPVKISYADLIIVFNNRGDFINVGL